MTAPVLLLQPDDHPLPPPSLWQPGWTQHRLRNGALVYTPIVLLDGHLGGRLRELQGFAAMTPARAWDCAARHIDAARRAAAPPRPSLWRRLLRRAAGP